MQVKELLIVLDNLKSNLEKLLENAEKKQKALVSMNNQMLTEVIQEEEKLIMVIKSIEQKRLKIIAELNASTEMEPNSYKLAEFIKKYKNELNEKEIKLIKGYEKVIKTLSKETMKLNNQNTFLINNSRQFVSSLMKIIYPDKTKSLLDKKV